MASKGIRKTGIVLLLFCIVVFTDAQTTILDQYIEQGLQQNSSLKQKQLSYEKSMYALKEAKGMFFPQISFNARYSVAQGGRVIDLPIGDLLNPVYSTLNQLTQMSPDPFPVTTIDNEEIQFLRPTEHETKLRLAQPVFNPQIKYNKQIKEDLMHAAKSDENAYRQELVFEIKTAYFNYLKTLSLLKLLQTTKDLVVENLRVNEKLLQNDKVTKDVVYRAKAEVSNVEHQQQLAKKDNVLAASYFNFLLNRSFQEKIEVDSTILFEQKVYDLKNAKRQALNNRYELDKLESYKTLSAYNIQLNKANKLPHINAVIDYGFQGETYRFDSESDYLLAAAVLQWDLFKGFQNDAKIQQAKIEQHRIATQFREAQNKIQLEVESAYYELEAAYKANAASKAEHEAMKAAFRLVEKKYKNNQASFLEFIDARNALTTSSEKLIMSDYEILIKLAALEKASGNYPLNQ